MSKASALQSPRTLSDALDLSYVKTPTEIRNRFAELAECLLLRYKLCIDYTDGDPKSARSFEFQLLEIEFYLHFPSIHEDPFCHSHVNQTKSGHWYFHRARVGLADPDKTTKSGGYRGGTRKGVDLAFGNRVTSSFFPFSSAVHGGILLRSMRSLSSKHEVISGPSLLVDKLLELTNSENIAELVNHKLKGHISAIDNVSPTSAGSDRSANLCFRPFLEQSSCDPRLGPITCSPRIGLELSHSSVTPISSDPRVSYIGRMYRYFTRPDLLKASTRHYNLVPCLSRDLIVYLKEGTLGWPATDLIARYEKESFLHMVRLEKYIAAFADGYQKRDLKDFVGTAGKGASANPMRFLTLAGVLCRLGVLE